MSARYAVFFCPDDHSELAQFGNRVLGRNAKGDALAPVDGDFPDRAIAATLSQTPAHYGFHATLKAPFELAAHSSQLELLSHTEALASAQRPIALNGLRPRLLAGFMALAFDQQPSAVSALASECVQALEPFRSELTEADLIKRKPAQLSEQQKAYLFRYGYPYVLTEFKFHMTLTSKLGTSNYQDYFDWLITLFDQLVPATPTLDRLAVFWQPDRSVAFKRIAQFPFLDDALL